MILTNDQARKALGMMECSRHFEERLQEYFQRKAMHGTTHLSIGQEAAQEGLALALDEGDWIVPTHRHHGHTICRGTDMRAMFSEMWGSRYGICKGLGGSMHMTDISHWNAGSSAVVGSGIPIAMGLALGLKKHRSRSISVAIFGDGATSRGTLHECMNLSSVWNLPLLLYLENNGYGMSASVKDAVATDNIARRSDGYRIPWAQADGNDVEDVYAKAKVAVDTIRATGRPYFLEVFTYRENGHSKSDCCAYRSRAEEEAWRKKDPIKRFSHRLIEEQVCSEDEVRAILEGADRQVDEAARQAEMTKDQVLSLDEAKGFVYADPVITKRTEGQVHHASYRNAVREALDEEMERSQSVQLWGEDIGTYGGCFGVTGDLCRRHPGQVRETPVSEESFTGMAVGASMLGIRPVVEIMYGDFVTLASDPLVNHASKLRFMSAGQLKCPMVLRTPLGSGTGHGSQHTQSLEGMFSGIPGLVVVAPSTPHDAKALLKSAIRSDNPVVFFEHKLLYATEGEVGDETSLMPLGRCDIKREGGDVTIVAYSRAVLTALEASEQLAEEGISCEVVDLCTLSPLDIGTVLRSVRKTGRLVMVEESNPHGSYGQDVVGQVAVSGLKLKAPMRMVAGKELCVPFTRLLEEQMVPHVDDVVKAVREVL